MVLSLLIYIMRDRFTLLDAISIALITVLLILIYLLVKS